MTGQRNGTCPFTIERPVMRQRWERLTFLHWPFAAAAVQRLLPDGLTADLFDGAAWVGLVPFFMHVATPGGRESPWVSRFCETNVRTYVRDAGGRTGIWFFSLDAARLGAVAVARTTYRLPYFWSAMRISGGDGEISYRCRRMAPGPRATSDVRVRAGAPYARDELTERDHFLTARWILFSVSGSRRRFARACHDPWPLHRAEAPHVDDGLIMAAGLPAPADPPLVHYSPGVDVAIGRPERSALRVQHCSMRHVETRAGAYADSVTLMQITAQAQAVDGVRSALVAMATDLNLGLLAGLGLEPPAGAGPNDMLVAVVADDADSLAAGLAAVDRGLTARPAGEEIGGRAGGDAQPPRTTMSAARRGGPGLALISVPGQHAFAEAADALDAGCDVMIFSDNVPVGQEVWLKERAAERGLLVMGPDCGTAIIAGVGLGFSHSVGRGPIGLVAASGTGAQQVVCLLAAAGCGVSAVLGVGGRDLSAEVGGRSARAALAALDADRETELIVLLSKPPAGEVAADLRGYAATLTTPVQFALIGAGQPDLTQAAEEALRAIGRDVPAWPAWAPGGGAAPAVRGVVTGTAGATDPGGPAVPRDLTGAAGPTGTGGPAVPSDLTGAAGPTGTPAVPRDLTGAAGATDPDGTAVFRPRGALRGLFAGGTLCDEAMVIAAARLGPVYSNIPLRPEWRFAPDAAHAATGHDAARHVMIDFGDDELTAGRPHPMIDQRLRLDRLAAEAADPAAAVIMLDCVLGHGAHPDPAAELAPAIAAALALADRDLTIVVSLIGARSDPQVPAAQAGALADAGAHVFASNAAAARFACDRIQRPGGAR